METNQAKPRLAHNFATPGSSDGVDYSWFGQRKDGQYFLELFPYHFSVVIPAIEPVPPPTPRLLIDVLKLAIVAANTIILIMPV